MKSIICLCLLAALHVHALAEAFGDRVAAYAPYLDGKPWPKLSVVSCSEAYSNTWVLPTSTNGSLTIQLVDDSDADFSTAILRTTDGRIFKTYCDTAPSPFATEVYSGDFNGDGQPDFMIVKPGSGCGLAAEYCTGIFAFSESGSYCFTRIHAMGLGEHSLTMNPVTKKLRLIHASFRSGGASDGRTHSFWVHRFFEWNGVGFQIAPNLPQVWIQYLNRSNHAPTKLLTPKLRAKLWAADSSAGSNIEW